MRVRETYHHVPHGAKQSKGASVIKLLSALYLDYAYCSVNMVFECLRRSASA
jgi:hypothetical protein